jgi:hypothetical protein
MLLKLTPDDFILPSQLSSQVIGSKNKSEIADHIEKMVNIFYAEILHMAEP